MSSITNRFYRKNFSTIPQSELNDSSVNKLECGIIVESGGKKVPHLPQTGKKYHSKHLNEDFIIDEDKRQVIFNSNVIYHENEIALLKQLPSADLPLIHDVKKLFQGEIILINKPVPSMNSNCKLKI